MVNSLGAGIICVAEERMVTRLQTLGASSRQPRAWVGTFKWMGLAVGTQQMAVAVSIKLSISADSHTSEAMAVC